VRCQFAEARDDIDAANDEIGTVYFNEEFEMAESSVQAALDAYAALLAKLGTADGSSGMPGGQRGAVQRAHGLKVEQLKGELQMLRDKALED